MIFRNKKPRLGAGFLKKADAFFKGTRGGGVKTA